MRLGALTDCILMHGCGCPGVSRHFEVIHEFSDLRIGVKLAAGFLAVGLLTALLGAMALVQMSRIPSASSTASPSRPTSWRSTLPWKPPVQANKGEALRW